MDEVIKKAILDRIMITVDYESDLLDLSNIGLTTEDFKESISTITRLSNLKELDLSGNKMVELPNEIALLTSLEKLNLSNMDLMGLPDSLPGVKELSYGTLAYMQYGDIKFTDQLEQGSKEIGLRELKELNLSQNPFISIPVYFHALKKLEILDLSDTQQTEIPEQVLMLPNLKELGYKNNYPIIDEENHKQLINKGVSVITNGIDIMDSENIWTNNRAMESPAMESPAMGNPQGPPDKLQPTPPSVSNLEVLGRTGKNSNQQKRVQEQQQKRPSKKQRKMK